MAMPALNKSNENPILRALTERVQAIDKKHINML